MTRSYNTNPGSSRADTAADVLLHDQPDQQLLKEQRENERASAALLEGSERQRRADNFGRKQIIAHRGLSTLPEFSVASSKLNGTSSIPPESQADPLSPTISSRRLKHPHPENSLQTILYTLRNTGATALEVDIHLSSDSTPVLSHDATLKRIVGDKRKVRDVQVDELEKIGLVKLETVLRILRGENLADADGERRGVGEEMQGILKPGDGQLGWDKKDVLLDIKIWNPVSEVVEQVDKVIQRVGPGDDAVEWRKRVRMGVWTMKYAHACVEHKLPIVHISRSIKSSWKFLDVPGIAGFNLHWSEVASKAGQKFLVEANNRGLPVWVWTVNDVEVMKWAIADKMIAGVCSDDPGGVEKLRGDYEKGLWEAEPWSWRLYWKWWIWSGINWLVELLINILFRDKL